MKMKKVLSLMLALVLLLSVVPYGVSAAGSDATELICLQQGVAADVPVTKGTAH